MPQRDSEGNKLGFLAAGDKPLTAHIGLKLTHEDKEALKLIPGWSDKLRAAVKEIIKDYGE
ncbi:MAG: hypothetical protein AAFW70_01375 [Cyanobacteria bacterium J06635_10]